MNPFGVSTYRVDPAELARWNADIKRAREDYYRRTDPPIDYGSLTKRAGRRRARRAAA